MYDENGDEHMVPVRNIVQGEIKQVPFWNHPDINIVDGKMLWRISGRKKIGTI